MLGFGGFGDSAQGLPGDPLALSAINGGGAAGFSSAHSGNGANFLFCDGVVRFLPHNIDPYLMARLSCRNDGQPVDLSEF